MSQQVAASEDVLEFVEQRLVDYEPRHLIAARNWIAIVGRHLDIVVRNASLSGIKMIKGRELSLIELYLNFKDATSYLPLAGLENQKGFDLAAVRREWTAAYADVSPVTALKAWTRRPTPCWLSSPQRHATGSIRFFRGSSATLNG